MLKKLEVDALKADLAAVTALLAARTEDDDPVGWLQLSGRQADLANIDDVAGWRTAEFGVG